MTEADWLACDDPQAMLRWVMVSAFDADFDHPGGRLVSDRKLRLFACACAELCGSRDVQGWRAWAECEVSPPGEFSAVDGARYQVGIKVSQHDPLKVSAEDGAKKATLLREVVGNPFRPVRGPKEPLTYPPPWPEWGLWLTPTVLSLAQAAYLERGRECEYCNGSGGTSLLGNEGERCEACRGTGRIDGTLDPVRLSVLADALEEAGCDSEEVLRHLRGWELACIESGPHCGYCWRKLRGPHVRGCWVVDLLLGRD